VVVSDTAADVAASLDALNSDAHVTSIMLTDSGVPVVTITAAQALGDTTALGKIANPAIQLVVSDSAVDISANFDALNADTAISSVTLTDDGDPMLVLSVAQATSTAGLLSKISNTDFVISVFDSVANILAGAASLTDDGRVTSVTAVDTASNILANASALAAAGCASQIVVDSAADVAANIGAIAVDASVQAIILTDSGAPALTLSVDQTIDDARALGEISNSAFTISIVDTAANVSANVDILAAMSQIGAVTLTDAGTPVLSLNVAQFSGDGSLLAKITNSAYMINIADTAAAASAQLDALNGSTAVGSITLSDLGTPTLTLTAAQALNDTTALGLITNASYDVSVTDSVANVMSNNVALASDPHVNAITIEDTAANVLASATALEADAQISSITVNDTAANITDNITALRDIPDVSVLNVVDSAAAVASDIDALSADAWMLAGITLTDADPVLTLTAEQAANDSFVLSKITNGSFTIAVVDSAANISEYLNQLVWTPNLTSITMTDSGSPSLNVGASWLDGDRSVLSKITNSTYTVNLVGGSAVGVQTFVDAKAILDAIPGGFSISDYASNVKGQLDALNADTHVTSITLTDYSTPHVTLSMAQVLGDATALGEITNSNYTITVQDTVANVVADASAISANSRITSVAIVDTAADVVANAAALDGDPLVSSIDVVDTAANIVANEVSFTAVKAPVTISVEDTAANVSAELDALNADASLDAISFTDTSQPILTLTACKQSTTSPLWATSSGHLPTGSTSSIRSPTSRPTSMR
jgi:hypothetical protein